MPTDLFPDTPPTTKKQLFDRVYDVIQRGWMTMPPGVARYNGTGGPGNFLEDLFGLTAGNLDAADSVGWELKTYSPQTNLITLFHKEASPRRIMRYMVSQHGWKDSQGRLSFRHTIRGKSDRFRVEVSEGAVTVRPTQGNGSVPYWSTEELLNIAASKLRRLLLVRYEKQAGKVRFVRADCFEDLQITELMYEIGRGTICIDFDCREQTPGSAGLRNHGTKFRIAPEDVCRVYLKKSRFVASSI